MLYTIICRGGLNNGKAGTKPTGSTIEMSEKDANGLPPGTVELAPQPVAPKPTPKHEPKGSKDTK